MGRYFSKVGKYSVEMSTPPNYGRRVGLLVLLLATMFTVIGAAFYTQDLRYSLPTPKPRGYVEPRRDLQVGIPRADGRPTLLCFASPDCGCSRFNQDHLWELSRRFGRSVRIVEVVESKDAGPLNSPGETWLDSGGEWAKKLGVYSTPQAVILGRDGRVAYRGNFNVGRFCSDPKTQFARIALEALVSGVPVPPMPKNAVTPYGCAVSTLEPGK